MYLSWLVGLPVCLWAGLFKVCGLFNYIISFAMMGLGQETTDLFSGCGSEKIALRNRAVFNFSEYCVNQSVNNF